MITLPSQIYIDYKNIEQLNLKELKIRKKLDIFITTHENDKYSLIFHIIQKSRFLQKDVDKIEEILSIVQDFTQKKFIQKIIYIESPLCSKAKNKLENLSWNVIV